MSKILTSPVKKWPGEVILSDPLTFPQVFAFEDALGAAREQGENATVLRANAALLPGVIACVEEWHLANFPEHPTPETFPATPARASAQVVAWLVGEIGKLFSEAEEVPNE